MAAATTLTVQVGQCGNQIGPELFRVVNDSIPQNSFIDPSGKCRAVCIDTEDKVVKASKFGTGKLQYRDHNIVCGHFGRGSNWAMGYHMEEKYGYRAEESFLSICMDRIRKEAERCDCFMSTLMMHSLAGGTGSGVGSRLTEEIRELFPNRFIVSAVVAPLTMGENPMQSYNSLLCFNHIYNSCDQVLLLKNDDFSSKFDPEKVKGAKEGNGLGFTKINNQFALDLVGILLPTDTNALTSSSSKNISIGMEIPELIRSVCPMSDLRLTCLDGIHREKADNFDKLFSNLGVKYKSNLKLREDESSSYQCISAVAAVRGNGSHACSLQNATNRLSFLKFSPWNPFPLDLWNSKSCISGYTKSLTVCSNSSASNQYLQDVWSRARLKYDHGAYLHWYEKYGCEKDHFEEAFDDLASTVAAYRDAVKT